MSGVINKNQDGVDVPVGEFECEMDITIEDDNMVDFSVLPPETQFWENVISDEESIFKACENGARQFFIFVNPNNNAKMPRVYPHILKMEIEKNLKSRNLTVRMTKNGSYLFIAHDANTAVEIIKIKTMFNLEVKKNLVKSNISCKFLLPFVHCNQNLRDLVEALEEENNIRILNARRFLKGGFPSQNVLITLLGFRFPKEIRFGYQKFDVFQFIDSVLMCKNCLEYGHSKKKCKNEKRCIKCGVKVVEGWCEKKNDESEVSGKEPESEASNSGDPKTNGTERKEDVAHKKKEESTSMENFESYEEQGASNSDLNSHNPKTCTSLCCIHCEGNHQAGSESCQKYQLEKKFIIDSFNSKVPIFELKRNYFKKNKNSPVHQTVARVVQSDQKDLVSRRELNHNLNEWFVALENKMEKMLENHMTKVDEKLKEVEIKSQEDQANLASKNELKEQAEGFSKAIFALNKTLNLILSMLTDNKKIVRKTSDILELEDSDCKKPKSEKKSDKNKKTNEQIIKGMKDNFNYPTGLLPNSKIN